MQRGGGRSVPRELECNHTDGSRAGKAGRWAAQHAQARDATHRYPELRTHGLRGSETCHVQLLKASWRNARRGNMPYPELVLSKSVSVYRVFTVQ